MVPYLGNHSVEFALIRALMFFMLMRSFRGALMAIAAAVLHALAL